MRSINPATGRVIRDYPEHSKEQVDDALALASGAFEFWREVPLGDRAAFMTRVAQGLRNGREAFALLMTEEMGKTLASAGAEVEKCALCCDFYAAHAQAFLAPEVVATDALRSLVRFDPLGPILAVMPWNFPFWQVIRFAVPTLMAGNVCLLKHAPSVPGCALALERLFAEAGFPQGCFQSLLVGVESVEGLIAHGSVKAVTLTGSVRAGCAVASAAGMAGKPVVLELGGSDPFVVLEDTDMDKALKTAVLSRTLNNGQSCIGAKRFIVVEAVAGEFEKAFIEAMAVLKVGDPLDPETDIGPLARADLREALHDQVKRSVAAGARLTLGGQPLGGPGFFYPPTVLAGVTPGMAAFDEETFGPVAALTKAKDEEEAVALANRTRFGLGASIWTADAVRGERVANRIEAGSVFVNGIVKSDPRLPFGGIKASGVGRELGVAGIRAFVNTKTVWIA